MPGPNRQETPEVLSQTPGFGMVPVYQSMRNGPDRVIGYRFDAAAAAKQGIIKTPKPAAILAEEQRLGGKEIEPVYATAEVSRGRGGSETVKYGAPIGYRYDNGKSEYVNFTPSGEYQGTVKRQSTIESALPFLAIAALPFLGPLAFEALGLTGAGAAGGAGLLGETAALGAGEIAALNTGGGLTVGGAGAAGMGGGTGLTAKLGADLAAGGLLTAGNAGLAAMGGAAGLTALPSLSPLAGAPLAAAGTGIASMGGGTGLTTAAAGGGTVGAGGVTGAPALPLDGTTPPMPTTPTAAPPVEPSKLPSWVNPTNALLAASAVSSIAKANETAPTAPTFTMAPYVPPSGRPFANIAMSPIATPYTPTRILGQYDPTMTPGGVSPYELIMAQMQAPKNLYADFEAGTNIGGFDPQKFVTTAPPNNMGGTTVSGGLPNANLGAALPGEINPAALGAAFGTALPNNMNGIELMNAINSGKISKGNLFGLLQA